MSCTGYSVRRGGTRRAAARAIHLADCGDCLTTAEQERKLFRDLVQLPRFGPEYGFVERVMAKVRVPTPSGDFRP